MKCNSTVVDEYSIEYWKMCRLISEKTMLNSTHEKILYIIKEETKNGRGQRYQAVTKITKILMDSLNEKEILDEIEKAYPQYT
ncbi:MAG: hypothetical protein ACI4RL_06085 [Ruminococcus sp.]